MVHGAKAGAEAAGNLPETPGGKTEGIVFAKGTLKNLEIEIFNIILKAGLKIQLFI